jgi:hypothetical protein
MLVSLPTVFIDGAVLAMAGVTAAATSATTAIADNAAEAARVMLRREPRPRRHLSSWPASKLLFMISPIT